MDMRILGFTAVHSEQHYQASRISYNGTEGYVKLAFLHASAAVVYIVVKRFSVATCRLGTDCMEVKLHERSDGTSGGARGLAGDRRRMCL